MAASDDSNRYRELVSSLPVVVWTTYERGGTTFISPNVANVCGFAPEEIVQGGQELWQGRIHPDDQARVQDALRALFDEETRYDVEYRVRHRDGQWIWLHDRALHVYERDGRRCADGVFSEITPRKLSEQVLRAARSAAEERVAERTFELALAHEQLKREMDERERAHRVLAESEERYRTLFESSSDAILIVQNGLLIDMNEAALSMFGWPRETLLNRFPEQILLPTQPDGSDSVKRARALLAAARERGAQRFEWPHRRRDGSTFPAEVTLSAVELEDNALLVAIVRDISARKAAEQAERTYAERLQALHQIDQAILAAESPASIAEAGLKHLRRYLGCLRASMVLYDGESGEISMLAADTATPLTTPWGTTAPLGDGEELLATLRRGELYWFDAGSLSRFGGRLSAAAIEEIGADIAGVIVGVVAHGELIGSINLVGLDRDLFLREQQEVTLEVASQLAIAIHSARLREQVERHSEELERRVAERTRELSMRYAVTAVGNDNLDQATTLARALEPVLEGTGYDSGVIHLQDGPDEPMRLAAHHGVPAEQVLRLASLEAGQGLPGWALERDEAAFVPDLAADPRSRVVPEDAPPLAALVVPMHASGRTVGALTLVRVAAKATGSEEEPKQLASVADQLGVVAEAARLRHLAEHAAVLEERRRLARDLHDSVSQALYSATLLNEVGRRAAAAGDLEQVGRHLDRLGEVTGQALKEMRLLIHQLRPLALEQQGLVGALRRRLDAVERRSGVEAQLLVEGDAQLPVATEEAVYYVALEALNNAMKHARARRVTVRLAATPLRTELEVVDDGEGFDPRAASGGIGMNTMRERADNLGGELAIRSTPGKGTSVSLVLGQHGEEGH